MVGAQSLGLHFFHGPLILSVNLRLEGVPDWADEGLLGIIQAQQIVIIGPLVLLVGRLGWDFPDRSWVNGGVLGALRLPGVGAWLIMAPRSRFCRWLYILI